MKILKLACALVIFLAMIHCTQQEKKNQDKTLIENDLPKFLAYIKTTHAGNAEAAFKEVTTLLNYSVKDNSKKNTYEARNKVKDVTFPHSEMLLQVGKPGEGSAQNDFYITLLILPTDSLFAQKVNDLLGKESYVNEDGSQVWKINGKELRLKKPGTLFYGPEIVPVKTPDNQE